MCPGIEDLDITGMQFVDVTSQPQSKCPIGGPMFDPYTTYDLKTVRGGYKQITDVRKCLSVDFNNLHVSTEAALWIGMIVRSITQP